VQRARLRKRSLQAARLYSIRRHLCGRDFGRALLRNVPCCYGLRSHLRADKSMVDFKRLFDTSMTAGHASQGRPRIPDHRIARKRGRFLARIIAIGIGIVKRFGRHDHGSLQ
jgi:hypothetical protein